MSGKSGCETEKTLIPADEKLTEGPDIGQRFYPVYITQNLPDGFFANRPRQKIAHGELPLQSGAGRSLWLIP